MKKKGFTLRQKGIISVYAHRIYEEINEESYFDYFIGELKYLEGASDEVGLDHSVVMREAMKLALEWYNSK